MNKNNTNKLLPKTRSTFTLNKYSTSMDLHRLPNAPPTRLPSRKSPIIDFPTSPLLVLDEMLHFSHPQHPLEKVNLSDLFTCAGCKEFGSGTRFICRLCDFQLHDFCALAPPSLNAHPFHYQHHLSFFSKPGQYIPFFLFFSFLLFSAKILHV